MMKAKLFGLAVIAASAFAGPAMAQAVINEPGRCAAQFPNANCTNLGPGNPYTDGRASTRARVTYRQGQYQDRGWDDGWNRTRSGFWPADAAAGVAGAAIGSAGAIATAPFRAWDNSYAYDNRGWDNRGWDNRSYAQRNGFVCTPGTWFKGEDGRRHICQ